MVMGRKRRARIPSPASQSRTSSHTRAIVPKATRRKSVPSPITSQRASSLAMRRYFSASVRLSRSASMRGVAGPLPVMARYRATVSGSNPSVSEASEKKWRGMRLRARPSAPVTAQGFGWVTTRRSSKLTGSASWARMPSEKIMAGVRYCSASSKARTVRCTISWTVDGASVSRRYPPCPPLRVAWR